VERPKGIEERPNRGSDGLNLRKTYISGGPTRGKSENVRAVRRPEERKKKNWKVVGGEAPRGAAVRGGRGTKWGQNSKFFAKNCRVRRRGVGKKRLTQWTRSKEFTKSECLGLDGGSGQNLFYC